MLPQLLSLLVVVSMAVVVVVALVVVIKLTWCGLMLGGVLHLNQEVHFFTSIGDGVLVPQAYGKGGYAQHHQQAASKRL